MKSPKDTTRQLQDAVRKGDLKAVRNLLKQGADPNKFPDNDAYPIFYAVHEGPEMVQLLIDHGANVNLPSGEKMVLTLAEVLGYTSVAAILRKAGARLRTPDDLYFMDPRYRFKITSVIKDLVFKARCEFSTAPPQTIVDKVVPLLKVEFPPNMPLDAQEKVRKEIRILILEECGGKKAKDDATIQEEIEAVKKATGKSEDEILRRFLEEIIRSGKNPFKDIPEVFLQECKKKYPDLLDLAERKFGKIY
jgi:hypothetical protein